ncbi:MAG: hypothetical protein M1812_007182 [Candelaria pacifica]|nr:MAG: hypothetical protein M1812_007182 [Candelaria pacifica]
MELLSLIGPFLVVRVVLTDLSFCFLPNGEETAVSKPSSLTGTLSTSTAVSAIAAAAQTTADSAVTGRHMHAATTLCIDGKSEEVMISGTGTKSGEPPAQFTGCRSHGEENARKDFALVPETKKYLFSRLKQKGLAYEATTSAIAVAGFILSFLVEYISLRIVASRAAQVSSDSGVEHNQTSDVSDNNKEAPTTRTLADLGHSHSLTAKHQTKCISHGSRNHISLNQ